MLDSDQAVVASSPSGESIGKYEAVELRDHDKSRFDGFGVRRAVGYINDLIGPRLVGVSPTKQTDIDYWLIKADGTNNKSKLGSNTITVVSQLVLKAAALSLQIPPYQYIAQLFNRNFKGKLKPEMIPSPIFSLINGGKHGTKNLQFQEFQVIPPTNTSFSHALQLGSQLYFGLKKILEYRNAGISVSQEGGFTPNLLTNVDALEIIKETLSQNHLRSGVDIFLGLDLAASQFYKERRYVIQDRAQPFKVEDFIKHLSDLVGEYNILILEDPLEEEDFANWASLNEKIGDNTYLVGDDLIAGNKSRLERAIKERACSGVLVKFNQSGTITEMLEIVNLAREASLKVIVSHRLGETNDRLIADFAVGIHADFIKFGAPVRGERVAKYNRLLEIETEIAAEG